MTGILYGIGVGPGDPELITVKALKILQRSKVVAYPAPDVGESFARAIAAEHMLGDAEEIPIVIPMRSERFPARLVYDEAAKRIEAHLAAGISVTVLCEGDPFFYGSFMYLHERLADRYRCEIVPGVSSLMASAAALGRPLAARNDVLTVIPAPLDDRAIAAKLAAADAVAIIKVGRHFARMVRLIDQAGLTAHACFLERISLSNQKIMRLADAQFETAPYFSMILIYRGAEPFVARLPVGGVAEQIS